MAVARKEIFDLQKEIYKGKTVAYDVLDKLIERSPDVNLLFQDVNNSVQVSKIVEESVYDEVFTEEEFASKISSPGGIKGISGRKK